MNDRPVILLAAHGERGGAANNERLAGIVDQVAQALPEAACAERARGGQARKSAHQHSPWAPKVCVAEAASTIVCPVSDASWSLALACCKSCTKSV